MVGILFVFKGKILRQVEQGRDHVDMVVTINRHYPVFSYHRLYQFQLCPPFFLYLFQENSLSFSTEDMDKECPESRPLQVSLTVNKQGKVRGRILPIFRLTDSGALPA